MAVQSHVQAQSHTQALPLALRCARAAFHRSVQCPREDLAVARIIPANATRRLECVRTGRISFVSLRFIQIGRRLPVRVHTLRQRSDNRTKLIASRDLRITEVGGRQACGTSEIPAANFEMETTIFVLTGKNTCSHSVRRIGIATGTATATIGGMVIAAPSLMGHG